MIDFVISAMILLEYAFRNTPSVLMNMLYLGYLNHEMRLQESPKSLWLTEE